MFIDNSPVLITVFFGTNDADLKDACPLQHVPLEKYGENLETVFIIMI